MDHNLWGNIWQINSWSPTINLLEVKNLVVENQFLVASDIFNCQCFLIATLYHTNLLFGQKRILHCLLNINVYSMKLIFIAITTVKNKTSKEDMGIGSPAVRAHILFGNSLQSNLQVHLHFLETIRIVIALIPSVRSREVPSEMMKREI